MYVILCFTSDLQLSEYTTLLTRFHASSVRGLTEEATKRAGDLINFLKNLRYVRNHAHGQERIRIGQLE